MEEFKATCGRILGSLPFSYEWEWDDALNVALVSFEGARADAVWRVLKSEFSQEWDFLNIVEAAESLSGYLKSAAGIFPGQSVLTSEGESGHVLFALWWPWGDGDKVSLRIGVFALDGEPLDREMVRDRLRQWFAV